MFSESELLPLSALQHLVYCERQAALIHVEQVWLDNVWTVEGGHLHEKVTSGQAETRANIRTARNVPLRSLRLGLTGRADVVEFRRVDVDEDQEEGAIVKDWPGRWKPYPVEYKRGKRKLHRADEVQLCAQAICLEEMLQVPIAEGALFYGCTRHRYQVLFDPQLRASTGEAVRRFRGIFESRWTPPAVYESEKCEECSLLEICRPRLAASQVGRYIASLFEGSDREGDP